MNKVCFIYPYFGKFPDVFYVWLNCCEKNKAFHWIIFTDDRTPYLYPDNVEVKYMGLSELKQRFEKGLGFPVALDRPYKLCDFRPLYGWLFEEELKEYSHWGYGDIDIIFGRLDHFITEERLNEYDKISYLGHMSILKNSDLTNTAFKDCNYREILQDEKSRIFDETIFFPNINDLIKKRGGKVFADFEYADIACERYRFVRYAYIGKPKGEIVDTRPMIFQYKDGRVYELCAEKGSIKRIERAYVHFQKRQIQREPELNLNDFVLIPNKLTSEYCIDEEFIKANSKESFIYNARWFIRRAKSWIKRHFLDTV